MFVLAQTKRLQASGFRVLSCKMSYSPEPESTKNLLSGEESAAWGSDEKAKAKRSPQWLKVFLYSAVIAVVFAFGGLVGHNWSEMDERCSQHVSQYCE